MIVIDLETTGLDVNENGIISIGAVDFDNQDNIFYCECKLREGFKLDPKSIDIHGFTEEQINNLKNTEEELLRKFLKWCENIEDKTLGGHNLQFDIDFLQRAFKLNNLPWIFRFRFVDLHSVAYFHFMKNKLDIPLKYNLSHLTLDTILAFLGIKERQGYHNALTDAKLTAKAFAEFLNNK